MFSETDLRDLGAFIRKSAEVIEKENKDKMGGLTIPQIALGTNVPEKEDDAAQLNILARQLEAIRYNPLLLLDILEEYDVPFSVLEIPLEELPMHINNQGILTKVICEWRFEKGV